MGVSGWPRRRVPATAANGAPRSRSCFLSRPVLPRGLAPWRGCRRVAPRGRRVEAGDGVQSGWLIALELALVLGLALFFGVRELRSLKRLREEREKRRRSGGDGDGST